MPGDAFTTILWFIILFIFIFMYPRLMLSQLIWKLEQSARRLEAMSNKANSIVCRKITKKVSKDLRQRVREFTDFFVVEPSNIDPYGLVKKIDQVIRTMEDRFADFVNSIAGKKKYNEKQEINYGLRAAIALHQIAKIVRHNVELAKKFKNLQIAMIIHMQLPLIERIAKGELDGTKAFVDGLPIGDSIGAMVGASLLDKSREVAHDVVCGETRIEGRRCFVLKAKGPAPHLGRIDEAIKKILRKHKIARVITIDAGLKLEGEKSGSVAEGVGFAMGGLAQREIIENVLLPQKKPIDSIVIKVGMEESISPMTKEIANSLPRVHEAIRRSVRRVRKNDNVLIIGVGNSCGVGDSKKTLKETNKIIEKIDQERRRKSKEKKGSWI